MLTLPAAFTQSMRHLLGQEAFGRLQVALDGDAPVSLRLNPARRPDGLVRPTDRVPWAAEGYYLAGRPAFTFDPLWHAGCYYVQEASSMFLEQVLRRYVTGPVRMLDLCAAPGGKSTHARSLLPEGSLLVANEVIRSRAQVLAENLTRWGHPDVVVTSSDPAAFGALEGMFDVILADVPCSGEGMFRKDAAAISQWSPEAVRLCASRQRRIVADAWPALRPGGLLIYSTCTFNIHENEENVRWICSELGAEPLAVDVPGAWQVTGSLLHALDAEPALLAYRFLPHLVRGEGLFMAVMRKAGEGDADGSADEVRTAERLSRDGRSAARLPRPDGKRKSAKGTGTGSTTAPSPAAARAVADAWLAASARYEVVGDGTRFAAIARTWLADLAALRQAVHVLQAGIPLAEVRGRELMPTQALALSTALRADAFPRAALDYRQALAYLRRESVALPGTTPRGPVLVTYRTVPLGFVHNLGTRSNNLYPQPWRIRTTYLPDTEVRVV